MVTEPLRIGICGLTHDHVWDHLPQIAACADVELAGAAESDTELTRRFQQETGRPTFADYGTLQAETSLDAVCIFADNQGGAELAVRALNEGLHVLIEKPMASSLALAKQMLAACQAADRRLMVNWPFAWWPQLQHALRLAAAGDIGRIWQVKYRAAHAGPAELGCSRQFCNWLFDPQKNGGGALMDYCGYGAVLSCAVLGRPQEVTGITGNLAKRDLEVEDNAILLLGYPDALSISEGSWTHVGKLGSYTTMLFGEQGTLLVEPRSGGRLIRATDAEPEGVAVEVPLPPLHEATAIAHFVHGIRTGDEFLPLCRSTVGCDAQAALEAGKESHQRGARVSLPSQ